MKRLMVALASVATAFGLYAADSGFKAGTGFEDGQGPASPAWTLPTKDNTLTVTEYATGEEYKGDRPAQYADGGSNAKYLAVKTTFGYPLKLNVSEATMGGIYFDSLVKFTACDEDPAADSYAGAKLVVYTKESEENNAVTTKLCVKGGQLTADGVVPTVFDLGTWDKGDAWVRLTIKSIANIAKTGTVPGFVVFIDGNPKAVTGDIIASGATVELNDVGAYWNEYNSANRLIPSLIQTGNIEYESKMSTIAEAGFDGQGSIDDLAFTTTVPFDEAADPAFFTFSWDENVAGVAYTLGDAGKVTLTPDQVAARSIAIPFFASAACDIEVTPAKGYVIDAWDADVIKTPGDGSCSFALVAGAAAAGSVTTKANEPKMTITINGTPVEGGATSIAEALALINDASKVTGDDEVAIALTKDVEVGEATGDNEGLSEFYLESLGEVVLDLAGHTITGTVKEGTDFEDAVIDACSPLTIIDSVGGGKVMIAADADGNYLGVLCADGADVVIGLADDAADKGATFEGALSVDNDGTISIVRGFFDTDPTAYVDAGSEVGAKSGDYWPVAPKAAEKHGWAIYLAEGDEENEFLIQDEQDLIEFATWANKTDEDGETFPTEGITFKQTADIELTDPFAGIGQSAVKDIVNDKNNGDASAFLNGAFKGTYDGGNYTISGFIHVGGDYDGFINSAYGATIKNIRISLGSATGVAADKTGNVLGVIAGFTVDTLVENCVTLVAGDYNTFKTDKTAAGIVCYASDGTVIKDCTNNLNIVSGGNEKAGGLVACAQQVVNTNVSHEGTGETIENCANYGNVTAKDGTTRAAGLVSYTDNAVTFKGENIVGKDVTISPDGQSVININGGSATVEAGAVIKVPAGILSTRHNGKAHAGLNYAMVDDGVATFVADSALAANGVYKVMATDCKPIIELEKDETITFDETLATIDATGITTAEPGYEVTKNDNTYAVTVKTYNITFTSQEGTTAPEAMTYTVESTFPLELADATTENVGTEFKGWTNATYTTAIKAIPALPETLGDIALVAQWDAVVGPAGWDPEADPTVPASEKGITGDLAKASFKALSTWATKYGVTFADNVDQYKDAFLLNCAPDAVETAKAAFKIANIAQGDDGWVVTLDDGKGGTIYNDGDYGNGKVVIESFSDVACTKTATEGDQLFYKAKLVVKEVGATK